MSRSLHRLQLTAAIALLLSPAVANAGTVKTRQHVNSPWMDKPVRLISDLPGYTPVTAPPKLDEYGGWPEIKFNATGFFHTHREGDRWWLVDPLGNAFINVGVAAVAPGTMPASQTALTTQFGDLNGWAKATTDLFHANGFNGSGGWSKDTVLQTAPQPLAYTPVLHLMSGFFKSKPFSTADKARLNWSSKWFPIFDPDFATYCETQVKTAVHPDDPHLLGYFSDNELPLPRLENYLHLDPNDPLQAPNLKAALDWVKEHNVATDKISNADDEAWIGHVMDLYTQITTTAIRHADPHHLCLGERFFVKSITSPASWKAEAKYCDVVAINYYSNWNPKDQEYVDWLAWSGMPFIVTEFYTKGDDVGFANTTGAGWIVPTQADRGLFYQNFTLSLLQSKNCVGWHWFKYMDNDPTDLKTDPSNRDGNKGIVSTTYVPYAPLVDKMRETNLNVYPLIQYFDAKK